MDKRFEERNEYLQIKKNLVKVYKKISQLSDAMGFLYNYCKAYSHLEGVSYFTPYTKQLRDNIEDIADDLYKMIDEDTKKSAQIVFLII